MTVQETPADRTLPCCFGDEAQVVRDMVIDTLIARYTGPPLYSNVT
jgi:hypothetical protein